MGSPNLIVFLALGTGIAAQGATTATSLTGNWTYRTPSGKLMKVVVATAGANVWRARFPAAVSTPSCRIPKGALEFELHGTGSGYAGKLYAYARKAGSTSCTRLQFTATAKLKGGKLTLTFTPVVAQTRVYIRS